MPTQKQYLDNEGLTELLDELGQHLKSKLDKLTVGDGIAIDNSDTIRTTGIPFGRCDSTSTATAFTATVPGIYKLEDGVCCMIENGVVTSASGFTLNVNGLGGKPCYTNLAAATRDTTIFNIAYTMLFVYDETRVEGGCWICYRGYDANTNTIGYQVRSNSMSLPASLKFYRYRLLFTSADGTHYVPANTSTSTSATSSKTVNQTPIDPFGHIVYYSYTTAIEANARPGTSYLWIIYTLSLGYSFNRIGAALTLTSWKPVYVKCTPLENGSAIIDADTPYVQDLPTTADGKIYIFLGVAYNATSIELLNNHPVYYHDGEGIRLWTGKDTKSIEYYNLERDSNLTPIFAAILGVTPTQSDLNTACEYLLNLVKNQGDSYGCSKKVIYQLEGRICLRLFHEGQLWDAGGSDNPSDSCEVDFELFDANNNVSMHLEVSRDDSGNWHPYVYIQSLFPQIQGDGNAITGINTIDGQFILEKNTTFLEELTFDSTPTADSTNPVTSGGIRAALNGKQDLLVSGTNIKTINNNSLVGSGNVTIDSDSITMTDADPNDGIWGSGDTIQEAMEGITDGILTVYNEAKPKDFVVTLSFSNNTNAWIADKTYAEIVAAYNEGAEIIVKKDEYIYYLVAGGNNSFYFLNISYDEQVCQLWIYLASNGTWTVSSYYVQHALTFDNTPTANSTNPVRSGGIKLYVDNAIAAADDTLVIECSGNLIEDSEMSYNFEEALTITNGITYDDVIDAYESGKKIVVKHTISLQSLNPLIGNPVIIATITSFNVKNTNGTYIIFGRGVITTDVANLFLNKKLILYTILVATAENDQSDNVLFVMGGSLNVPIAKIDTTNENAKLVLAGELIQGASFEPIFRYDSSDPTSASPTVAYLSDLENKQNTLVSGTNIKTVNNTSLLGSGNIDTNEFYKIPSEDCTAIFYATSGYIPDLSALNTACNNLLAAIRNGKIPIMKFSDGIADVWVAALINYPESSDPSELSPMSFTTLYGNYTTYTITAYKDYNTSNWVVLGIQTNLLSRLTFDSTPTTSSSNPVTSGGIKTALDGKQDALVSGTNIKTVNNNSLLGNGDIHFDGSNLVYSGDEIQELVAGETIDENLDRLDVLVYGKQDALVSGTNIKTVNNNSLLGEGNVQVGDITGEELETEIEELESTLLTDALRKSEQVLSQPEKTQVLTNLGIADVAKESNLKTVNGASLVGTGNIEVLSVNAGDIDVMQATGTSTTGVMSQKAVTEYGRKLLDEEAVDGSGTMMREILTSLGWEFDKYTQASGNLASSTNNVVTPYIEIGECGNHRIEAAYFLTGGSTKHVVFFNDNKTKVSSFSQYNTNRYFATIGDVSTKYVRYTVHVDRIRDCYIYDHTAKQFLFKGDEYIDNIINNYNVSYGYVGDKNVLKHTFIKPTCFLGTLCYYKLSQFPNLDPRTCDGLSIALDGYMNGSWGRLPFLLMHTGSANFNTANYFAIASDYGTIRCGVLTNYYQTVVNGCSLTGTNTKFAHLVITFDFKTGTITSYNNGVLAATNTPETYSESDLRTFLDSCTELYLSWSLKTSCMAVFPYVLTPDDVKSIYGIGVSSTKGELIPDIWNANILHPQTYSGQNIGIYLRNTNIVRSNDGNAAVLTSNSTSAQFGFTGIHGTINNHIYEWDMEVVSGTWTQYSRGMQYHGNYYKVVNIYDSNGNDVSYNDLTVGNYHVVCKPNNILAGYINAVQYQLNYIFTTTEGAVMKVTNLKVVEKGAALICGINNFRGNYFEQENSNKVPITRDYYPYGSPTFTDYYTTYKEDIIEYSSSTPVQFTGQMAVDINNNKVYVGYLTGAGTGTWKQINNS